MKHFKWIAYTTLLTGLMAVPVSANPSYIMSPCLTTPCQVAYELLGSINLSVPAPSPLFTAGSTLTTEMYLGLGLSGPTTFSTSTIYSVCANNSGNTGWQLIGSSLPYSSANLTIPLTSSGNLASILAGNYLYVTSDNGCAGSGNMLYTAPAGAAVGNATLTATMFLGGGSLHAYAPANVVQVLNQIGTTLSQADLIQIDYITGPANGTTLVPAAGSTNLIAMSQAKITVTNQTYNLSLPPRSLNLAVTLYDTQGWTGITSAFLAFNGDCVSGNFTTAVNTATSLVNGLLTLSTGSSAMPIVGASEEHSGNLRTGSLGTGAYALPIAGASSNGITVCITTAGNVTLPSRIITGSYVYFPSSIGLEIATSTSAVESNLPSDSKALRSTQAFTGFRAPYNSAGANATWQTWAPNGYQAFCPYVYAGEGAANSSSPMANDTFVRFVNASAANATVFAQVYNGSVPSPTPYTLGVIAPYSSGTFWGGDLAAMAGIPYGTTFAAQYIVTAPPLQVTGCAYYKRVNSSGSNDRSVPLLTDEFAPLVDLSRVPG